MTPARLREFEAFDAVMRCGSATRAGEALGLSQPAISKLLGSLEYAIGLRLFDRARRRLTPTLEALRLHEEVARLFSTARRVAEVAQEMRDPGHGELRVAALPMLGLRYLPGLLARLREQHSGLRIAFSVESSREVRESLLQRTVDVGFLLPLVEQAPLTHAWTIRLPGVAVLPRGHRLAQQRTIAPTDFIGERFISLGRSYRMRHLVDALFDGEGVSRELEIETQNANAACEMATLGLGVTLVDSITAMGFGDRAVVLPIGPTVQFQFNVLVPPDGMPPRPVLLLIDLLRETLAEFGTLEDAPPMPAPRNPTR